MKKPVVIFGIGEIGSVIARGFLRLGHPVFPIARSSNIAETAEIVPTPEVVVVAVGEKDLQTSLAAIPAAWHDRLLLIQNELLPRDWVKYSFDPISIASIWFEKKKGQDSKVVIPSVAFGPAAQLLRDALGSLDIPVRVLDDTDELLTELVVKNLYILTTNIAGLQTGGTVSELWENHRDVAEAVFDNVLTLQEALTERQFDRSPLLAAMIAAFEGDPEHKCMGRSAPARLQRAMDIASNLDIELPKLQEIAAQQAG